MDKFVKLEQELYDRLIKWVKKGANRKRKCCKKHSLACKRFLRFLENDEYYFDKNELMRFYFWCKQFKHRAGILEGQPIELVEVQMFWASSLLCFKYRKNNRRVTKVAYIQVGRKNSKSQMLACLNSYFLFTKGQQEAYLSGWNKEGSEIVYKEILHILKTSDFLKDKWKEAYHQITNLSNNGFIKPLSREAKNNDNANNPSLATVDEYKDHKTDEIWSNLKTGMIARPEGLLITITTAGFDINCPCKSTYDEVSKILDPDISIEDDTYFIDIHEMETGDKLDDESLWIKANPIVATYEEGIQSLRSDYKLSKLDESKLRKFLTKNMNIWVDMADNGYMNMRKWKDCTEDFDYNVFSKGNVFVGVDISKKDDLTSVVFGVKVDDKYYFKQQSFIPETTYNNNLNKGQDYWYKFKQEGNLTITKNEVIDVYDIIDYINNFKEEYNCNIVEICYDSWSATQFALEMEKLGYNTIEITQNIRTLCEGTVRFREEVYKKNVVHENDSLYNFCMSNAVLCEDSNKNFKIDKKRSKDKIDPVDATMNIATRIFFDEYNVDINDISEKFFKAFDF